MSRSQFNQQKRKTYKERFPSRYGITTEQWRQLKKDDPQKAHLLRMKVAKKFYG